MFDQESCSFFANFSDRRIKKNIKATCCKYTSPDKINIFRKYKTLYLYLTLQNSKKIFQRHYVIQVKYKMDYFIRGL